jgi:resuscitation-promoting factor RpfA
VSAQGSPGARPTIVIATAAPALSASSSPAPSVVVPTAVAASPGEQPSAYTEYVVQPGDTLRSIAEREYGDATQWPRIYDANRDVIGADPDTLVAGTTLRLPAPS